MTDSTGNAGGEQPSDESANADAAIGRLLGEVFDSPAASDLVTRCIKIGLTMPPEGEADSRAEAMRGLLESVRPEIRTRAALLTDALADIARWVRRETMQVKIDAEDPDLTAGEAEITADGWLVVRMGSTEIGRVPFDPRRDDGHEQRLAEDIIGEYQRLHVLGDLERRDIVELPRPGRRRVVAIVKPDATPTADG